MSSDGQDIGLISASPLRDKDNGSRTRTFKTYVKCRTCSCCCVSTWFGLLLAAALLVYLSVQLVHFGQYMALPKGLSLVALNYAVGDVSDSLPGVRVGSNILLNARYRGSTPSEHNRLYQYTVQHADWAQPRLVKYWDHDDVCLYRADEPGTYRLTVQTGYRPWYVPTPEEDWTPYSVTQGVEEVTVSFSVAAIVASEVSDPETALPTVLPLDFMTLGLRYALPPIDI
ncbi:hypothetical protein KIPB_011272, partial [Kipferlia bialata]|eukprot:g11272.t1